MDRNHLWRKVRPSSYCSIRIEPFDADRTRRTMKTIIYRENGGPEVLRLVERDMPEPGPGEIRVRVAVSGVNPTDW